MYKTIRQGENSLQYTILPQQDDGRTGPAAGQSRRNGGARAGSGRKKSLLALLFVCTIITFAILIPFLVTSDWMPAPGGWFNKNQKVRDFRNPVNVKLSVDPRPETHIIKGTPLRTTIITSSSKSMTTSTTTAMTPTTAVPKSHTKGHSNPLWSDALTVTDFQNLYKNSDESMELGMHGDVQEVIPTTAPMTTTMTPGSLNSFLSRVRQRVSPTTTTTARPTPPAKNYPKHFSLQKHEKTAAPEVPPQPVKAIPLGTNTEDIAQVHQNWLQSQWSYVDPYLKWRNYAADDRVVLPLILGVALTAVVLIILMCYLVKRKRLCRKSSNSRHVFENVEAQIGGGGSEDHENLLTNENQSEEE